MAEILRFVDPDNVATVRLDLNAVGNGGASGFKVLGQPDFGGIDTSNEWFTSRAVPGDSLIGSHDPNTVVTLRLGPRHTTWAAFQELVRALNRELDRETNVIEWRPNDAMESLYIDTFRSPKVALLHGQAIPPTTRFLDVELTATIWRKPYLRGAELDPAVNKLVNPTLLLDQTTPTNRPDDWTLDSASLVTESIDAATESYKVVVAGVVVRNWSQVVAAAAPGDIWTGSYYVASSLTNGAGRVVIEYLDAADVVLVTHTPAATTITVTDAGSPQRITNTTTAAPASTAKVKMYIRLNSNTNPTTFYLMRAQLEKASSASTYRVGERAVSNDPAVSGGRVAWFYNAGNAVAPVDVRVKADAANQVGGVRVALYSGKHAINYANTRKFFQCEAGTLGTDTSSVADAAASGGNAASISFATTTAMATRVTVLLTTLLSALQGDYDIVLRTRRAGASAYSAQLHWDMGGLATQTEPAVTLSSASYLFASSEYYDVPLARISLPLHRVPKEIDLRIQVQRTSGTDALLLDHVAFIPVTQHALMEAGPGGAALANEYVRSRPETQRIDVLDANENVIANGIVFGAVPLWAPPGLSLVYVNSHMFSNAWERATTRLTQAPTVAFIHAPRFLT